MFSGHNSLEIQQHKKENNAWNCEHNKIVLPKREATNFRSMLIV